MKRILASISAALIVVAGTVSCNNDPKADGVAQITSFSLQSSLNPTLGSNVTGDIDEQAKTISIVLPEGSGSEFIPTFTVTDDDVVKAGSTEVTSGVTSISVTDGTKLSVTAAAYSPTQDVSPPLMDTMTEITAPVSSASSMLMSIPLLCAPIIRLIGAAA